MFENIKKDNLIFIVKCLISIFVFVFYIFRMINNIILYFEVKKDFKELTETIKKNNEVGEKRFGSFDSPNSDVNIWNKNNDENRQKAGLLKSEKLKDMFYDTAYFGGVIGVIWLNFGTAF